MPEAKQKIPDHILDAMPKARIQVFIRVVLITVGTIAVFGLIGALIDMKIGSWPKFFVIFVLCSFPFTQAFLFKMARATSKKHINKT